MPSLQAPAKLNLGLRVTGTRNNSDNNADHEADHEGYHEIESLFVPVDLSDRLEIELDLMPASENNAGVEIDFSLSWRDSRLDTGSVPADTSNLASQAALRFCEAARLAGSLRIRLEKSIPSGAGLGGGSSDAAATLRILAAEHPGALSRAALAALGLELGADVPFFLDPRPALVTGIGESITPLEHFPELWILLANPGVSLATSKVFRAFDSLTPSLTQVEAGSTMRALRGLGSDPVALSRILDGGLLRNDLEPAARRLCPPIERLKAQIRDVGATWVAMSGSGATVYGIFAGEPAARAALADAEFGPEVWARVVRCAGI